MNKLFEFYQFLKTEPRFNPFINYEEEEVIQALWNWCKTSRIEDTFSYRPFKIHRQWIRFKHIYNIEGMITYTDLNEFLDDLELDQYTKEELKMRLI